MYLENSQKERQIERYVMTSFASHDVAVTARYRSLGSNDVATGKQKRYITSVITTDVISRILHDCYQTAGTEVM